MQPTQDSESECGREVRERADAQRGAWGQERREMLRPVEARFVLGARRSLAGSLLLQAGRRTGVLVVRTPRALPSLSLRWCWYC